MGLTVLSLFDGISCGYVALKRANIDVDTYYASEIDEGAIAIATSNHPNIVELGSVTEIFFDEKEGILFTEKGKFNVKKIDIIIGGSPCTDFSTVGHAKGMKTKDVEITSLEQYLKLKSENAVFEGQSYLFWEYVRLLREIKPKYFMLENVVMSKKWQTIINEAIGFLPIKINSSLLSAQNRPRLYWTNIEGVEIPKDKNINLDDIIDEKAPKDDVSSCKTVQASFKILESKYGYVPECFNAYNRTAINNKACALSRGSMVTSSCATLLFVKKKDGVHFVKNGLMDNIYKTKLKNGRYNLRKLSLTEMERLQTLPDDYTKVEGIGQQKRSSTIGNGWTVDVIAHIFTHIS